MLTLHRTPPPASIEAIISTLLPPSRREQVLGDLAERHADPSCTNWGPELRYLMDAVTVVPAALYGNIRRGLRPSTPLRTVNGTAPSAMRQQAEAFQDRMWRRNLWDCSFNGAIILWSAFQKAAPNVQIAFVFALAATLGGLYHRSKRIPIRPVPPRLSDPKLRIFHRGELWKRYEYACRSIPWCFVSFSPALAVLAWGKSGATARERITILVFEAIACFWTWRGMRKTANKLLQSIEDFDKTSVPQA